MRRAVFLDRDGVINRAFVRDGKPYPPANLDEMEILPGVSDALADLQSAGFLLIVISNQPDVPRGITLRVDVEKINTYLASCLPIDEFRVCYHDTNDSCNCRKPSPGSLLEAAKLYDIDLEKSYMVGDRWRDVEAGQRAGCKTIFIDYGYEEKRPESSDIMVKSLGQSIKFILG